MPTAHTRALTRGAPRHLGAASARRTEKVAAFTREMASAALEKRVLAAEEATRKVEDELRQREAVIAQLESDRRWLADREKDATETMNRDATQWREEKVATIRDALLVSDT